MQQLMNMDASFGGDASDFAKMYTSQSGQQAVRLCRASLIGEDHTVSEKHWSTALIYDGSILIVGRYMKTRRSAN